MPNVPIALTVAGSETTGGAGLQADLKTFEEYGVHGMVAITSIVTMAPENWAHQVAPVATDVIEKQFATVLEGPKINAMKTGLLPGVEIIRLVRENLLSGKFEHIVIDPVMVCKGDVSEVNVESADALRDLLTPLAEVVTPNLFEAGVLSGLGNLKTIDDLKRAAKAIHGLGAKNVVVKGGKALDSDEAVDVFYDGRDLEVLAAPKVDNIYNQGAGCSFSAAIAAGLAKGMPVKKAVTLAKSYVRAAIANGFAFNRFTGPVYHSAYRVLEGHDPGKA
ncbi:MAG: bifunctional hydroxymethylpyrimidine kinase/phosphomethylpyrimidine kinase [Lachnospiraceae bacterium]|nr:bifunctional hydroxymethylpyrimidine kinase/phosphomethylpyrimidine kinase [Lachnospiraceae bacterium]